ISFRAFREVRRRFSQDVALHLDARQLRSQTADFHLLDADRLAAGRPLQPSFPLRLDPVVPRLPNHSQTACRCGYALARLYQSNRLLLKLERVLRSCRLCHLRLLALLNHFSKGYVLRGQGQFVDGLKRAFHAGALQFHGHLLPLAEARAFASWLRVLFRHDWVVYAKRPFGGPEYVLRYLGAYTHRVAISNGRLVALADGNVAFRWRDSAHGNKKRLMTLPVEEFLRRFLLHLLPRGFVRIRNFGFLANRRRAELLPLCLRLLQPSDQPTVCAASLTTLHAHSTWNCPLCGKTMQVVERLSAAHLLLRSPPHLSRCAA